MRIPWLLVLALSAGCELAEGGGLAKPADGAASDVTLESGAADADVDTSTSDASDEGVDAPWTPDTGVDAPYDAGVDAGPVLTITGGTYTLRGADAGVCSVGGAPTSFQLVNDRDASVDLVWADYTCAEVAYGVVAPLGSKNQGTFVNHVWRIRNDADKKFLAEFVLQSGAANYTVTVH